jgi:hypothetical protein
MLQLWGFKGASF